MEETPAFHGRLNHKEEVERGEQLEPARNSNLSFNKQEGHQPIGIHEESHPNLIYE